MRSTPEALHAAEKTVGVKLPGDVFWFFTSCGAANAGAVSNDRAIVADTLRYRGALGLPNHFVVLDDRNESGTVFLDTSTEPGAVAVSATQQYKQLI